MLNKVFLVVFCTVLVMFAGVDFLNDSHSLPVVMAAPALGKGIDASTNYVEPGKMKRLMIMELGATTCIPCKQMVPVLEALAKELAGKVDIQFVDVYKRRDLADKFGIMVIPTQIFFDKKGKEVYRHQGFYPKAEIDKKLKELGL
ncbi:MAG TPA: thioredoxin family protein [Bacillota bacterium]|nr:thioredoxin family protein [Bacillota bacterium]